MINEWSITFFSSFLFSIGLTISGMINPNKVTGFLDITGQWDPSLLFVMAGAILVNIILFNTILKKSKPLLVEKFHIPTKKDIDKKLILGAIIFGIGWGLTGVCPGPAVANILTSHHKIFIYIIGMISGMIIFEFTNTIFLSNKKRGPQ